MSADSADADRVEPACGLRNGSNFVPLDEDSSFVAVADCCNHCFDGESLADYDGRLVRSTRPSSDRIHKRAADVDGTLVSAKARSDGGDRSLYEALSDESVTSVADLGGER